MDPGLVRISRSQIEFLLGRKFVGQDRLIWVSRGRINELREFDESKHPRGQPENAGQFGPGGGGGESAGSAAPTQQSTTDPAIFGFDKKQQEALTWYTGNEAADLNKFYRNEGKGKYSKATRAEYNEKIANINDALKKSELQAEATLYRGISKCAITKTLGADHNAEKMIGKELPLGGFQSTSYDPEVASRFGTDLGTGILMVIKAPVGTRAINMEPFAKSTESDEKEILLGQGSIKITEVTRTAKGSDDYEMGIRSITITGVFTQKSS